MIEKIKFPSNFSKSILTIAIFWIGVGLANVSLSAADSPPKIVFDEMGQGQSSSSTSAPNSSASNSLSSTSSTLGLIKLEGGYSQKIDQKFAGNFGFDFAMRNGSMGLFDIAINYRTNFKAKATQPRYSNITIMPGLGLTTSLERDISLHMMINLGVAINTADIVRPATAKTESFTYSQTEIKPAYSFSIGLLYRFSDPVGIDSTFRSVRTGFQNDSMFLIPDSYDLVLGIVYLF